jgi:hypothetical protein
MCIVLVPADLAERPMTPPESRNYQWWPIAAVVAVLLAWLTFRPADQPLPPNPPPHIPALITAEPPSDARALFAADIEVAKAFLEGWLARKKDGAIEPSGDGLPSAQGVRVVDRGVPSKVSRPGILVQEVTFLLRIESDESERRFWRVRVGRAEPGGAWKVVGVSPLDVQVPLGLPLHLIPRPVA